MKIPKNFYQKLVIYILLALSLFLYAYLIINSFSIVAIIIFVVAIFHMGFLIKILSEIDKGKQPFSIFKKRDSIDDIDIIINNLEKIDSYKHIIPIENGVILIDGSGVNVIKMVKGRGTLSNKGGIWTFNDKEIPNPFKNKADNYYLIKGLYLNCSVENVNVVNVSELIFKIENNLIKPKYSNVEIDEMYKKVKYGYNEDKIY